MTPGVPVGLATKLGVIGAALLALSAALTPLLPDTGAGTSQTLATLATVLTAVTVAGRMLQSAAQMYGAQVSKPTRYSLADAEEKINAAIRAHHEKLAPMDKPGADGFDIHDADEAAARGGA